MPVKTIEQVTDLVTAKGIAGFLVDTCVYKGANFSFGNGLLNNLIGLSDHELQLLITDVVYHEVLNHFEVEMIEQKKSFEKAIGILGGGWGMSKHAKNEVLESLFGTESVKDYCKKTLDGFLAAAEAEIIQCHEFADVKDVLSLYHERKAPFSERKKHEFPDALTLLALDKWACDKDKQVVVVSGDGDIEEFCKTSDWLICVKEISQALSTLHSDKSVVGIIAQKVRSGELNVEAGFKLEFDDVWDKVDVKETAHSWLDYEVDVADLFVLDINGELVDMLESASLIEHTSTNIKLELHVPCTIRAEFDVSFSKWDKEDSHPYSVGACFYSRDVDVDLLMIADFYIEAGEFVLGDFELQRSSVKFNLGDIGPWDDEPEPEPEYDGLGE